MWDFRVLFHIYMKQNPKTPHKNSFADQIFLNYIYIYIYFKMNRSTSEFVFSFCFMLLLLLFHFVLFCFCFYTWFVLMKLKIEICGSSQLQDLSVNVLLELTVHDNLWLLQMFVYVWVCLQECILWACIHVYVYTFGRLFFPLFSSFHK